MMGFCSMPIGLCHVIQTMKGECSTTKQTANVSEKAKQMCYIPKNKPINLDVVRIFQLWEEWLKTSFRHKLFLIL